MVEIPGRSAALDYRNKLDECLHCPLLTSSQLDKIRAIAQTATSAAKRLRGFGMTQE